MVKGRYYSTQRTEDTNLISGILCEQGDSLIYFTIILCEQGDSLM